MKTFKIKQKEKSRNYLKWKNSDIFVPEKSSSCQKEHLYLRKGNLANPEGQTEIKFNSLEVIFDTIDSN